MIDFNIPPFIGNEIDYIKDAISTKKISGDGKYTKLSSELLEKKFSAKKILLTTSGSTALDMAALLCDIKPGDEVILPSYTFSSTANSFALFGARLKFVDVRPDTMNIDEELIEDAITPKTKVIVAMHYAGVSCEMDKILEIAHRHNLIVVEDAAQGVMSTYKGRYLGTIADIGCYSFHETKNYSMGEGGAIVINNEKFLERAEIIREKGTNRAKFFRGQVDKYTWVDIGGSYLPSEINAAYLYAQLEKAEEINNNRLQSWNLYREKLDRLINEKKLEIQHIPSYCKHNAHMFYIKLKDLEERTRLISFLKERNIGAVFHYIPLHSAPAGLEHGEFIGKDKYTTSESERLVRLPLYYNIAQKDVDFICSSVEEFFSKNK